MDDRRGRVSYVIGPDGSPLTMSDLPAPGTKRWVIRRKAEVVAAVRGGLLSLDEACRRYTLTASFGSFDGFTYAIMAIIVVGAAFMMPSMAAIVTATCGALFIFGSSLFLRAVMASKDASAEASADWNYTLALELRTVLVYAAVFCLSIALVHGVRMLSKQ